MPELDRNFENTVCLIEFSSNTTHIRAYDVETDEEVISPLSMPTKLGQFPEGTKNLNPEGTAMSLDFLDQNSDIINRIPKDNIRVIGTGSLRDADDTKAFTTQIEGIVGVPVDVISGEEESCYSAIGVMSSFDDANGVIWDMGGRSSEFAIIKNGEISSPVSLPLGSQAIREQGDSEAYIKEQLATLPPEYSNGTFENFYVIGGTPRRLLGQHQDMANPSGGNEIHGYSAGVHDIQEFTQSLLNTDPEDLGSDKRFNELLPYVGPLLAQSLEVLDVKNIVASKNGTRAGVLHELEQNALRADDLEPRNDIDIDVDLSAS